MKMHLKSQERWSNKLFAHSVKVFKIVIVKKLNQLLSIRDTVNKSLTLSQHHELIFASNKPIWVKVLIWEFLFDCLVSHPTGPSFVHKSQIVHCPRFTHHMSNLNFFNLCRRKTYQKIKYDQIRNEGYSVQYWSKYFLKAEWKFWLIFPQDNELSQLDK